MRFTPGMLIECVYKGVKRVAYIHDVQYPSLKVWDFIRNAFRTYIADRATGIKDFTGDHIIVDTSVFPTSMQNNLRYFASEYTKDGYTIFMDDNNHKIVGVKVPPKPNWVPVSGAGCVLSLVGGNPPVHIKIPGAITPNVLPTIVDATNTEIGRGWAAVIDFLKQGI